MTQPNGVGVPEPTAVDVDGEGVLVTGFLSEDASLFEDVCHSRDVEVPLVLLERLADWKARTVTHGGATLLIADLSAIVHI